MREQPLRGFSILVGLWLLGLFGVDTSDYRYKTLYFRVRVLPCVSDEQNPGDQSG
jgi:hypothetical protein